MSFNGKLEGKDTSGLRVRVVLDGDSGDISAGGNGRGGDVRLLDDENQVLIMLSARQTTAGGTAGGTFIGAAGSPVGGVSEVGTPVAHEIPTVVRIISDGSIFVGGPKFSGKLRLLDKDKKTRIALGQDAQGNEGRLIVFSSKGQKLLEFDSAAAGLYVGGEENEGDVIVRDSANQERIKLDGGQCRIWLKTGETETISLDGEKGDIILQNADCAEEFDVGELAEPGSTMVVGEDGKLRQSGEAV